MPKTYCFNSQEEMSNWLSNYIMLCNQYRYRQPQMRIQYGINKITILNK